MLDEAQIFWTAQTFFCMHVGVSSVNAARFSTLHLPGGQKHDRPWSTVITVIWNVIARCCLFFDDGSEVSSVQETRDWDRSL